MLSVDVLASCFGSHDVASPVDADSDSHLSLYEEGLSVMPIVESCCDGALPEFVVSSCACPGCVT